MAYRESVPTPRQNDATAAVERALQAVASVASPEATAVGQAIQTHVNTVLAQLLNPEMGVRINIAQFATRQADVALREQRRAALTELAQCAIELQEAANIIRGAALPRLATLFQVAAERVRAKIEQAGR